MRLKLTNGTDSLEAVFDAREQKIIEASKRPVSKAFEIAKKRLDIDGWYPQQGVALTGIQPA